MNTVMNTRGGGGYFLTSVGKNGLRDRHAVEVNFIPLISLLSDKL